MRARPVRIVSVGTTPVQIRDTTKMPIAMAIYRYASGGGTIDLSSDPNVTPTTGKTLTPDTDFTDFDTGLRRYMVASAGSIDVEIEEYEN